jgi:plasmid stabilization system protein ParE
MPEPERQLVWSPEAESDLLSIWSWGAAHFSPDTADIHLRDIQRAAAHLIEFPEVGVARDQIARHPIDRRLSDDTFLTRRNHDHRHRARDRWPSKSSGVLLDQRRRLTYRKLFVVSFWASFLAVHHKNSSRTMAKTLPVSDA